MTGVLPAGLPSDTVDAVRQTLGGATVVAGRLPGRTGGAVLHAAREAFTNGLNTAALGAACTMAVAGVLAAVLLRRAGEVSPSDWSGVTRDTSQPEFAGGVPAESEPGVRG
ncbi:MAG: transporter [Actinoallomurus sp.]|nr:transporter [Actinoallomurus sp.]